MSDVMDRDGITDIGRAAGAKRRAQTWDDLPVFPVRDFITRSGFRGEDVLLVMNYLEPGMELGMHSHPFEQIACILQGRMIWHIGDEVFEAGPGSVLRVPPDVMHGGKPIGTETVLNLDIFAPIRKDYLPIVEHQKADFPNG
jgi:quercetin dioxygenase-like cupin family protein